MTVRLVHPVSLEDGDRVVDEAETVEAYQLTPADAAGFTEWAADATVLRLADGGAAVLVDGVLVGEVALGDFLVRRNGELVHELADGFWQRYAPAGVGDSVEVAGDA